MKLYDIGTTLIVIQIDDHSNSVAGKGNNFFFVRYGDLEDEAQGLGVRDEPQVRGYFKKLHPFAIDDVTTLPFVQVRNL